MKLFRDESGATAIEYGLIAGIVSVGIIAALTSLKGSLNATFTKINNQLGSAGVTS
jgi:pilus assembly protein Flp/PilA